MRFVRFGILLIIVTLVLAACGGSASGPSSGAAAPTTAPASEAAQATQAPAAEATQAPAAAAPTSAAAAAEPTLAATAAPAAGESPPGSLVFGSPTTYNQPDGMFLLKPPSGWQAEESSAAGESQVIFRDPTGTGAFIVRVIAGQPDARAEALTADLETVLKESLGATDLTLKLGARGADGRLPVDFVYTGTVNGKPTPFKGGGYSAQRGNLISFTLYSAPEDEFGPARSSFETIASSYKLNPGATLK